MKTIDEKLKESLKKENVDYNDLDELFKPDVDEEHQEMVIYSYKFLIKISKSEQKEYEFLIEQVGNLEKRIKEEGEGLGLSTDANTNEILEKYKRWEKILNEEVIIREAQEENMVKNQENNIRNGKYFI